MIVRLKGYIEELADDYIDLDVNGVVFRVFVSKKGIDKILDKSSIINLFVYELIKENERLFFGFIDEVDREMFSDLLRVQGVGGKMAMNIMSFIDTNDIVGSIVSENSKIFTTVSGVGNKLAMRIVNELRETMRKKSSESYKPLRKKKDNQFYDLVSCLENLGYNQKLSESTANKVLSENREKILEDLIPIALKYLSKPNLR